MAFVYITPEAYAGKTPDKEDTIKRLRRLAAQPPKPCDSCKSEPRWKLADTGMCFACTTGESDNSNDYELVLEEPANGQ